MSRGFSGAAEWERSESLTQRTWGPILPDDGTRRHAQGVPQKRQPLFFEQIRPSKPARGTQAAGGRYFAATPSPFTGSARYAGRAAQPL